MNRMQFLERFRKELSAGPAMGGTRVDALATFRDKVVEFVAKVLAELGPDFKTQLRDWALFAYDNVDIPYVSGTIEASLKAAFRPQLLAMLDRLLDVPPPPAPVVTRERVMWGGGIAAALIALLLSFFNPPAPPNPGPGPGPVPPIPGPPEPGPGPTPPNPVPPTPVKTEKLWLIVLEHMTTRDAKTAAVLTDTVFLNSLCENGKHRWLLLDKEQSEAAPYLDAANKINSDSVLLIADANTKTLLKSVPTPTDKAAWQTLVDEVTGKVKPAASDLPEFTDHNGETHKLGLLPLTEEPKMMAFADYLSAAGITLIDSKDYREWDTRPLFPVEKYLLNQKSHGSCVGFSAAGGFMKTRALRGLSYEKLSGAYIYSKINGGRDFGAYIPDALVALEKYGTCKESEAEWDDIYPGRYPASANETAKRFMLDGKVGGLRCKSWEEACTALQMGYVVQFGLNVGRNFENFDNDGVAGYSPGSNHSVHACGMKKGANGRWLFQMYNSWGKWGPYGDGTCYVDQRIFEGGGGGFIHLAPTLDPQDPNLPPVFQTRASIFEPPVTAAGKVRSMFGRSSDPFYVHAL